MCFGCHLRLRDSNGAALLKTLSDDTGELTIGVIAEADFTYISPLDQQYGINSEGKISQFEPETKQHVSHTDRNNNNYFGTQVIVNNNANIQYNVYRSRATDCGSTTRSRSVYRRTRTARSTTSSLRWTTTQARDISR
jgi:hypothetical protein